MTLMFNREDGKNYHVYGFVQSRLGGDYAIYYEKIDDDEKRIHKENDLTHGRYKYITIPAKWLEPIE